MSVSLSHIANQVFFHVCPTVTLHAKIAIFYELLTSNNYIDNCHLMVRNVYVDFKVFNQAPLCSKLIILLDCGP